MLGPIIQRFSRTSYRWTNASLAPLGPIPGFPAGAIVLPRTSALFARFNLADIPEKRRLETLRLELEQQAPFENPAGWVFWCGSVACVWYWQGGIEVSVSDAAGMPAAVKSSGVVPETALWPKLGSDQYRWVEDDSENLHLLQFLHSTQGLFEKRFTHRVEPAEACAWLSRHGARLATEPHPDVMPALGNPVGQALEQAESSLERRVFPAMAALCLFFVLVYGVAIVRASLEAGDARARVGGMQQSAEPILELRNRASNLQAQNEVLRSYQQLQQTTIAADLANELDVREGRLLRWSYRDRRLEVSWEPEAELPDATDIIARLEKRPEYNNVQAQTKGDSLVEVSMDISSNTLSRKAGP